MLPIRTSAFTLPRKIALAFCIFALVLSALVYMFFQARFLIAGPRLALEEELTVVQHDRQIVLEGIAENITAITLNGRKIQTSETGAFSEPVVLENGYTIVTLEATDRFGRTATLEHPFVYTEPGATFSLHEDTDLQTVSN